MGMCRTSYGRVLATRGDWAAADGELTRRPPTWCLAAGPAAPALARLGELRARQARIDEARSCSSGPAPGGRRAWANWPWTAVTPPRPAMRPSGRSARWRRRPARARRPAGAAGARQARPRPPRRGGDSAGRPHGGLRRAGNPLPRGRAPGSGEVAFAREISRRRGAPLRTPSTPSARRPPPTAAVARLGLARALATLGRDEAAAAEARAARRAFGARATSSARKRPERSPNATGELSTREVEVLRLVARGLSDAQIAERLVISPHTVHRHVANVRAKLRLPSRAAAVAYASRANLSESPLARSGHLPEMAEGRRVARRAPAEERCEGRSQRLLALVACSPVH